MKINVAIMFGGRSVEHEISVISALQAAEHIDREKYEVVLIYITKQGKMYTGTEIGKIDAYKNIGGHISQRGRPGRYGGVSL